MTKLLALDQSTMVTGYAIFEDGVLVKYGKFEFNDSNVIKRIIKLRDAVKKLIEDESITKVALEEIQMQGNVNNVVTFKVLAFVLGALEMLCIDMDIPHEVIPSGTWKKACDVKGAARAEQKRNAQAFVLEKFEIKAIQDIVDAICLGYSAVKAEGSQINWA